MSAEPEVEEAPAVELPRLPQYGECSCPNHPFGVTYITEQWVREGGEVYLRCSWCDQTFIPCLDCGRDSVTGRCEHPRCVAIRRKERKS